MEHNYDKNNNAKTEFDKIKITENEEEKSKSIHSLSI